MTCGSLFLWGAHWECSVNGSLIRGGDGKQKLRRPSECESEKKLVRWRKQWYCADPQSPPSAPFCSFRQDSISESPATALRQDVLISTSLHTLITWCGLCTDLWRHNIILEMQGVDWLIGLKGARNQYAMWKQFEIKKLPMIDVFCFKRLLFENLNNMNIKRSWASAHEKHRAFLHFISVKHWLNYLYVYNGLDLDCAPRLFTPK